MQELHLVGFTTDRRHLIFSARQGSKSGGFVVPVDDDLLAAIDQLESGAFDDEAESEVEEALAPAPAQRVEARLSVREIQARLRAGDSVTDVARRAAVDDAWVERFAPPVRAEQRRVIEKALGKRLERARGGESAAPLRQAVAVAMAERGIPFTAEGFEAAWSARLVGQDRWEIEFAFLQRGRTRLVSWTYDVGADKLTTSDRTASQVGFVSDGDDLPPASATVGAVEGGVTGSGLPSASSHRSAAARKAAATRKPAAKKAGARKSAAVNKTGAKKAGTKKAGAKKAAASKAAAKKKAAAEKAAAKKKAAAEKAAAKKVADRRKAAAAKADAKRAADAKKRAAAEKVAAKKKADADRAAQKKAAQKAAAAKKKTAPAKKKTAPAKKKAAPAKKKTASKRAPAKKKAAPQNVVADEPSGGSDSPDDFDAASIESAEVGTPATLEADTGPDLDAGADLDTEPDVEVGHDEAEPVDVRDDDEASPIRVRSRRADETADPSEPEDHAPEASTPEMPGPTVRPAPPPVRVTSNPATQRVAIPVEPAPERRAEPVDPIQARRARAADRTTPTAQFRSGSAVPASDASPDAGTPETENQGTEIRRGDEPDSANGRSPATPPAGGRPRPRQRRDRQLRAR